MKKVAAIIDDMFEDVEYTAPAKAFKAAGHDIITIGLEKGKTVKGKKKIHRLPLTGQLKMLVLMILTLC